MVSVTKAKTQFVGVVFNFKATTADDWFYCETGGHHFECIFESQQGRTEVIPLQGSSEPFLQAEDYPALAAVWDNDADAVFDNM